MNQVVKKSIQYGDMLLTLEAGEIARQATSSVIAKMGDTVVLVTAVVQSGAVEVPRGFFPLTVNYQERTYAAGKVPGGYFKREGRPTETEILTSRLIDRALRPMFPDDFENEIQIIATVLSLDNTVSPDVLALIAASAALSISGAPFLGPVAAARVGYKDGIYLLNPNSKQLEQSSLDLVVAGSEHAVIMVESGAKELSERTMLGGVLFGHSQMQTVIQAIKDFAGEAGAAAMQWQAPTVHHELKQEIKTAFLNDISSAYSIQDKLARRDKLAAIRKQAIEKFTGEEEGKASIAEVVTNLENLEKEFVRQRITSGQLRIDGRDHKTVRPITIRPGFLPRTHGSALFTRGETQAIVVATLGTGKDALLVDALEGERKERFMLHYNFPPYSVGEIGQVGSPKRREIGHGRLARRAIEAVLPSDTEFPYVIRTVSEITESNGSSSMATVCGTSIALMDAGVPLKAPVAGIAMGLVKEGDQFVVLTDILGDEDHLGDMDFKVAGTEKGVTALQMDIKIDGITSEIMETALEQARHARLHILDIMNGALAKPREQVSNYAPRILTVKVEQDKIREVIGKGGATIRSIIEESGASVDISDDGTVTIAAVDQKAGEIALKRIAAITTDIEEGAIYEGKVTRLVDFGAFVSLVPFNKEGLLHISQIANQRVERVSDFLHEGEMIRVKVIEIDRQGRIRLSLKALATDSASTNQSELSAEKSE